MTTPNTTTEDTIDLRELFFTLLAQWKFIALCIILGIILALLYLRVTAPSYQVDALVQVEDPKGNTTALLGDLSKMLDTKASLGQTEIEIIQSRLVLAKVADNLHLDILIKNQKDTSTNRLLSQKIYQTIYTKTGVIFKSEQPLFQITQFEVPDDLLDQALKLVILDRNNFILELPDDTEIKGTFGHTLVFMSSNGQTLKLMINAIASNLEPSTYILTKLSTTSAVKNIDEQLSVTEKGKQTGILALNYQGTDRYLIQQVLNEILSVYSSQNIARRSADTKQTLDFLQDQLPKLKSELEASEQKFNQFREKNNTVDVNKESELMLTEGVSLETTRIELKQKQAELAAKYTDSHPAMAEINAQLKAIEDKSAKLDQNLKALPEIQRQYLQLYRDVQVNTELYTALLNNYQQLKVAKAGEIGNVRVVDTAALPIEPIKPKKLIVLIMAIFMGGFIGTMIALLRNMIHTGIKDTDSIENNLGLPVYATIPRSIQQFKWSRKKQFQLLAQKDSDDIAIESIRSIRTVLHFAMQTAKNNVIMISGASPDIGKSFISANLAAVLAQNGQTVLLVDGDLRRGYLHQYMKTTNTPGLSEYLENQSTIQNIIHHSAIRGLDFIARGKGPKDPAERLNSANFAAFIEYASTHYDHVIIDSPPILAVTDSAVIGQYVGITLMVVRYARTHIKELKLSMNRFEQAGVKINGVLLNDIHSAGGGAYSYGYGYGYNYNYAYKYKKKD